ncbi:MAG: GspE/PulE family protein, partial [Phycisphaerae bacterium]
MSTWKRNAAGAATGPSDACAAPEWLATLATRGQVTDADVRDALRAAEGDADAAGEWLVGQGRLAAREVVLAKAEQAGLAYIDIADYRVNPENRACLPEALVRAQRVFPLFRLEGVLTLAAAAPLELSVLDQIRLQTGCEVDVGLASEGDIRHLIESAYGGQQPAFSAASQDAFAWHELLKDVADAPAVKLVNVLLEQAAATRASDIHIDPEDTALRVRFRVDGMLREVPAPPKALLPAIVSRIKVLARLDIAETRRPQDGHFKLATDGVDADVRVSTLPSADGEAVVLRLLPTSRRLLTLEELGMDAETLVAFDRLARLPHGMVLVTGPTGSGKTTTLYSALQRLDRRQQTVVTLEDPVEVRLTQTRQVAVNARAGLTFEIGLRAILRQDPDVILVGEIRDRETAEIAMQAALTGHLLLSTLHTNSAAAAIPRLIDMGVPGFLVASSLAGVLAQRLCRRLCAHCARPVSDTTALRTMVTPEVWEHLCGPRGSEVRLQQPVGCSRCAKTGFAGRVGVFELLVIDDE